MNLFKIYGSMVKLIDPSSTEIIPTIYHLEWYLAGEWVHAGKSITPYTLEVEYKALVQMGYMVRVVKIVKSVVPDLMAKWKEELEAEV